MPSLDAILIKCDQVYNRSERFRRNRIVQSLVIGLVVGFVLAVTRSDVVCEPEDGVHPRRVVAKYVLAMSLLTALVVHLVVRKR